MSEIKILSIEKRLKEGVHETWTSDKGTYYKFTLKVLLDGAEVSGTAMSNKTEPSWKLNIPLTCDVNKTVNNGTEYINFKNIKDPSAAPFGGGGMKANPSFGVQKVLEAAWECTLMFFEINKDSYNEVNESAVLDKMYQALILGTESKRWINMSAMKLSLLKMKQNGMFGKSEAETASAWLFRYSKALSDLMENQVKQQVEVDKAATPATT